MKKRIADKTTEERLRSRLDDLPYFDLQNEINSISIDFIREVAEHIDIKQLLWDARPWNVEETTEEHMMCWHSHLKEFWKEILTDEKYNKKKEK